MINYVNDSDFNEKVKKSEGIVIIDFYADWCGPCKMQGPVLEELQEEIQQVKIYKLDVDKNSITADEFKIQNIPTILVFKNGEMVDKKIGFQPKEVLSNYIKEIL
ncbi:MAG: thioredoxin [Clostridiales bacterium]|nr:thioredoxin [Clostridiales bacterium]